MQLGSNTYNSGTNLSLREGSENFHQPLKPFYISMTIFLQYCDNSLVLIYYDTVRKKR